MKGYLKPLKKEFEHSVNYINDNMEIYSLTKLVKNYKLDMLSNMEQDTLTSDIDEVANVFESLILSYASKVAKLEIRDKELTNNYVKSIIDFSVDETETNVLNKHANLIKIDSLLYDKLKSDSASIMLVMEDNENYNIYFIDTFDVLNETDIKYINRLFNEIKKSADETDNQVIQKLLNKQQECGNKYANKLKVLKKNQYLINQLAILNNHFKDVAIAMYQLELILN